VADDIEADCTSCGDTGWVSIGFEFDGTECKQPCPSCGLGDDVLVALTSSVAGA
jgi:rubrerythrin